MAKRVAVIPGDGIGPEIVQATMKVLEAMELPIEFVWIEAGRRVWEETGRPISEEDLETIKTCDAVLKGPIETPVGPGTYRSVTVRIRKELGLYANVRPVRSIEGLSPTEGVNMVIVRENTEGLYSGIEYRLTPDVAVALRLTTREGARRVCRFAFEYARRKGFRKVTAVHKANILKETCGLFLEEFRKASQNYPEITPEEMHVDAAAYRLVVNPRQFEVIVTSNLFGDILSDLAAGLTGSLGVAPSANVGDGHAMFEAVHGTAPDIAGKGIANPAGLMRSAAMMLDYLGFDDEAGLLERAVLEALKNPEVRTPDVGGSGNTETFTSEVLEFIRRGV